MATLNAGAGRSADNSALAHRATLFFGRLARDERGRDLLAEQDHRIEFDLSDGTPFFVSVHGGSVTVHEGMVMPRSFDANDVIHFQLQSKTLRRLFDGRIRFTDALVPTGQDGKDAMLLLECTLFKWSVLNWVGRLFRAAQLRGRTTLGRT